MAWEGHWKGSNGLCGAMLSSPSLHPHLSSYNYNHHSVSLLHRSLCSSSKNLHVSLEFFSKLIVLRSIWLRLRHCFRTSLAPLHHHFTEVRHEAKEHSRRMLDKHKLAVIHEAYCSSACSSIAGLYDAVQCYGT